jgi:hypothetical protein
MSPLALKPGPAADDISCMRRLIVPGLLVSLAVVLGLPAPAHAERPGWYANPSLEGPAQVGATLVGNSGGIKCEPNCQGTAYEWLSCTGPGPAGADRPTGGLPFDGHPAPGCVIRVPFSGSLTYVVGAEDAGRYIQLHIVAENIDCGDVNYSAGTQECNRSQGHAYTNTIGPIAGGTAPAPAPTPSPAPAPPPPAAPAPSPAPAAIAPANSSPPAISGYAEEGESLTVTNGTWTGTEPLGFSYQWFRCSTALRGCQAIPGATASSYTAAADDVGARLTATVTASNARGGMPATAARTPRVLPAQPQPGYRVLDVSRLRATHRLLVARVDGPKTVRARGTATLLIHVADSRGFMVRGAQVQLARKTGRAIGTTGASGVAVLRVRVGAPKTGRLVLSVRASKPEDDALHAERRVVLRVLLI